MRTIALRLPEEDRRKVSAFYASLPAPAGPEAPPNLDGKRLYRVGDPARGLAACASCHGAAGEGDAANPPLAGQPAAYPANQPAAWRQGTRTKQPPGQIPPDTPRIPNPPP